ncbi:MAG: threonine aldolase family protein, partial [Nocardioidaceae bacterium]
LANLLAVRALVERGTEVLGEFGAQVARAEMGAHGVVNAVTVRTWSHPLGHADPQLVEALLAPDLGPFLVRTSCISIENTHNFAGGRVQPRAVLAGIRELAVRHGVRVHLDGARVWNAHVRTGTPLEQLCAGADTAMVSLSKGLGAPVGSLMLGDAELVADARIWRKRLGGGWRQAGILAAADVHALDHHVERLADGHANAAIVAAAAGLARHSVETNIVVVPTDDAAGAVDRCRAQGVLVSAVGPRVLRAVTHLGIDSRDAHRAADVLANALGG